MPLRLNAFELLYSSRRFTAYRHELPNAVDLRDLRESVKTDWFVHWRDGVAWGMPRIPAPKIPFGRAVNLDANEYEGLSLLAARTSEQLGNFLPQHEPLPGMGRGFHFVTRKRELVRTITKDWANLPALLRQFEIRPQFSCEARLMERRERSLKAILVVDISMRWQIHADLDELGDAGVDLEGLYVVRREPVAGHRSVLGKIRRIHAGKIEIDESYDGATSILTKDVRLEPTRRSFTRCVDKFLGSQRERFWQQYELLQADYLGGKGFDECLVNLITPVRKQTGVYLGPDISVAVGSQIEIENVPRPFAATYCFDSGKNKQSRLPWAGLNEYGPYDRHSFPNRATKLLLVCPEGAENRIELALKKFKEGIPNSAYSKGFARTFHLVTLTIDICTVTPVGVTNANIASIYASTVERQLKLSSNYDGAIVIVRDEFARLSDHANPYLYAKAIFLMNGIPVQEARLSTITEPDNRLARILQNISVALYAKMGGIPWTISQDRTVNHELVVGMGFVETTGNRFREKQRVVGITTVFRGNGNYLFANVASECRFDEYRDQLRHTMVDVLTEAKQRNGWKPRDMVRLVFHASKSLLNLEIDKLMQECVAQVAHEQVVQFAFVDVLQDHPFHVFDPREKGKASDEGPSKGAMTAERGTAFQLGKNTWLLATRGVPQIKRPTTPLPNPLLIHLHSNSAGCDLPYLTAQVLQFTSLTWRSVQPASEPVTIFYVSLIADLLTRLKTVPGWSPNVLNTRLRTSKWFL